MIRRLLTGCAIAVQWGSAARADFEPPIVLRGVRLVQAGSDEPRVSIVMRDKRIVAVGADVVVPRGAEEIDGTGLVCYPGFVDGATTRGFLAQETGPDDRRLDEDEPQDAVAGPLPRTSAAYRRLVHPHWRAAERYDPAAADQNAHRKSGFTTALVIPPRAILGGYGAAMELGDGPRRRSVLVPGGPLFVAFETGGGGFDGGYPITIAGGIALFRQTMSDARWCGAMRAWAGSDALRQHDVPVDRDLEALTPVLLGQATAAFFADTEDAILRALDAAAEQNIREPIIVGGVEAWKVIERLKHDHARLVLSLALPEEPKTADGARTPDFGLRIKESAASRESAIRNPQSAMAAATSSAPASRPAEEAWPFGDDWEKQPFEPLRVYQERKRLWDEKVHNAALLHKAGVAFAFSTLDAKSPEEAIGNLRKMIEAGLPADAAVAALTVRAAELLGVERQVGRVAEGQLANLVVMTAPLADKNAKTRWVFVEGKRFEFETKPPSSAPAGEGGEGPRRGRGRRGRGRPPSDAEYMSGAAPESGQRSMASGQLDEPSLDDPPRMGRGRRGPEGDSPAASASATAPATSSAPASRPAWYPQWTSEIEADRKPALHTGGNVLIRHVNVLTLTGSDPPCPPLSKGGEGGCDVLVRDGKIIAVGPNLATSKDVLVLDLPGYYVCPGIIDPHSHMASSGGLNEASISVSPEFRLTDVINHADVDLYRAAAGGVTMIHTMHGSANTIGGQNATLRLKWGRPSAELKVPEAHRTIKFALGENVKRSNGPGNTTRFPASRMGVEATMRRSLAEAGRYRDELKRFEADKAAGKDPKPVRRDLRLEALCEVLDGTLWVHCHCYRSDEILRLLSVAEDFGFRIGVLQHVLEGYRVIPEIVRHGCAASTFSDWWTYKLEAADAVPYNAARMEQGGVVATVNSDSPEVGRHLNLEAAKCVRYGGLAANDAMRLCTLNGAITLGLDAYCGSIAAGKWADLAIYDGHPLDTYAKCVLTLVGGEAYFQHRDLRLDRPPPPVRPPLVIPPAREPLTIPPAAGGVYALRGATIHPISGPEIVEGVVVFSDAGIRAVGPRGTGIPAEATLIDAAGLHVWPGLINGNTQLGLSEIGSVPGGNDMTELGTFQPDIWAASAVHPHSDMIAVTRAEGVTTALVSPGGGTIAGRASLIRLSGWTMPEMVIRGEGPLVLNLPSLPTDLPEEGREARLKENRETWRKIREFFDRAKLYVDATAAGQPRPSWLLETDDRFEATRPYLTGRAAVMVHASDVKQILEAVKFARKYDLRLIICDGPEAWKVADLLAEAKVAVIVDTPMLMPGEFDPWDSVYRCAGVLDRAGVRFCFGGGAASLAKQLGTNAGMAVGHGLDAERAMYALTLGAAKILGIDGQRGSIEAGKAADLIVTSGNPCQATSRVLAVFIDGRPTDLTTKHTRLDDKFVHRPPPTLPPERSDLSGPPPRRLKPIGA